jgi:hypothetical protein
VRMPAHPTPPRGRRARHGTRHRSTRTPQRVEGVSLGEAGSPSGGVVALPSRGLELHPYVQTAPGKRGPTSTLASMTLSPTGVNAHPATAQRVAHRSQRQAKALTPLTAR